MGSSIGHDVAGAVRVDLLEHRRERGRLTGAGGAGDEDETAVLVGDLLDRPWGGSSCSDRLHAEGDDAEDDADGAALLEDVHTEAAQAGDPVGEVRFAVLVEALPSAPGS